MLMRPEELAMLVNGLTSLMHGRAKTAARTGSIEHFCVFACEKTRNYSQSNLHPTYPVAPFDPQARITTSNAS
jgi:hypothetical protein